MAERWWPLSYGNPITPEITEAKGKIVQYYQYARFEYWPEGDEDGNYVTLGEIGRELGPPLLVRRFATRGTKVPLRGVDRRPRLATSLGRRRRADGDRATVVPVRSGDRARYLGWVPRILGGDR